MQSSTDVTTTNGMMTNLTNMAAATLPANTNNLTSPSDYDYPDQTVISVIMTVSYTIVFLFGVIGNALVVFVIWKNPEMSTATNIFLVNLCIADLLVLMVCMPIGLIELYSKDVWLLGSFMCKLASFLEICVSNASVMTMLAISFERYYAICRPLEVLYTCTKSRAFKIIIGVWLFSSSSACPFFVISYTELSKFHDQSIQLVCRSPMNTPWKHVYNCAIFVVFFLLPTLILMTLYTYICRELLRSQRGMAQNQTMIRAPVRSGSRGSCNNGATSGPGPSKIFRSTMRYTVKQSRTVTSRRQVIYMLIAVIIFSFSCLLPFRIVALWLVYSPVSSKTQLGMTAILIIVHMARILFYINSAGNPILYNMLSTKFRQASKRSLDNICRGNKSSPCRAKGSSLQSRNASCRRYDSFTRAEVLEYEFLSPNAENGLALHKIQT